MNAFFVIAAVVMVVWLWHLGRPHDQHRSARRGTGAQPDRSATPPVDPARAAGPVSSASPASPPKPAAPLRFADRGVLRDETPDDAFAMGFILGREFGHDHDPPAPVEQHEEYVESDDSWDDGGDDW